MNSLFWIQQRLKHLSVVLLLNLWQFRGFHVHGRVRVLNSTDLISARTRQIAYLKPSRPQLALQEDHSDQPVDSFEVVDGGEVARVRRGRLVVVATGSFGATARTDLHCVDSEHERLSSGGDGHSVDLKAHSLYNYFRIIKVDIFFLPFSHLFCSCEAGIAWAPFFPLSTNPSDR